MIPSWVKDAIFYQIFPDRFFNGNIENDPENVKKWEANPTISGFQGGDLEGIIKKFDYLLELGINAIYLNPIFRSTSTHRYDTVDYFQIDPKLGDLETFHRLIDTAHRSGVKIILDGVFNHTARGFFAFNDILENGEESPYKNWYHIYHFPVDAYSPGKAKDYSAWWDFKSLPKLNVEHKPVRDYLLSVSKYWIEQGADGWRLDVPNEINDDSFWEQFRNEVKSINSEAYLCGEIWEASSKWVDNKHFDGLMNYPLRDAILKFLGGKTNSDILNKMILELEAIYSFDQMSGMYNLLGSHDTERILTIFNGNTNLVKLALLILLTFPGAPSLYYGDEIGVLGGKDPDCRKTFPWVKNQQNLDLFEWTKKLIQFRKIFNPLRNGKLMKLQPKGNKDLFAYARMDEQKIFVIIINRSKQYQIINLDLSLIDFHSAIILNNLLGEEKFELDKNRKLTNISIPPESGFLLH